MPPDADGNSLTYTVPASGAGAPMRGTVSVSQTTGHSPTSRRQRRARPPEYRLARTSTSFTVTVSDGQGGATPVTVQVGVLPGVFENSNTPASTQANLRRGDRRQSRVCGQSGHQHGLGPRCHHRCGPRQSDHGGSAPTGVAASPDGSKVYVTNRTSGSVSVIARRTTSSSTRSRWAHSRSRSPSAPTEHGRMSPITAPSPCR